MTSQMSTSPTLLLLLVAVACCVHGVAGSEVRAGPDQVCHTCPYFLNTTLLVTTPHTITANLTCGVRNLDDRQVSWIRRHDLHVLTTGTTAYTTDGRFRVRHLAGSPYWTLEVGQPTTADSGLYECQVSTQPKIFRRFTLTVVVPKAVINGPQQLFMKVGSDINITCSVKDNIRGAIITWYHTLPNTGDALEVEEVRSAGRGGVQLVTDKHQGTSWLLVTHATWRDAGNYTCSPAHGTPAHVAIHVLDEETPAAMQHDRHPTTAAATVPLPCLGVLWALACWGDAARSWVRLLCFSCLLVTHLVLLERAAT